MTAAARDVHSPSLLPANSSSTMTTTASLAAAPIDATVAAAAAAAVHNANGSTQSDETAHASPPLGRTPTKHKKHKDRGLKFNEKHALKYGLSVCSRNAATATVESVMCKFCVAFGKESARDATRKRRATANIKYFRQPFRADHYLSHLEINHKVAWSAYEQASNHEKELFFAAHIEDATMSALMHQQQKLHYPPHSLTRDATSSRDDTSNSPISNASHHISRASPRIGPVRLPAFEIERAVVEQLIHALFSCRHYRDSTTSRSATSQPDVFVSKGATYAIAIKHQRLFDLAIKFVACGASPQLAARMVQCTHEETTLAVYSNCSPFKVAGFVSAVLASNLQKLAHLLRASWTFGLVLDAAVHQGTAYVAVRVRLWHRHALHDVYVLTLPAIDRQPMLSIVNRLEQCLDVLDPRWRAKLLGTTTRGSVVGVAGLQQALAARLASSATSPGVYRIWSSVYELERVVHRTVCDMCDCAFVDELVTVLATLQQDGELDLSELPDVAAALATSQSVATPLLTALKWLLERRATIAPILESAASTAPTPLASWWICVAVTHRVLGEVAYFLNKLRTLADDASVSDQVQELCKLTLVLADTVGARRDLLDPLDTAADTCVAGAFVLPVVNAQQFILTEGGPVACELFDALDSVNCALVAKSVARFAVALLAAIAAVAHDGRRIGSDDVDVVAMPPCVLPHSVVAMGRDAFVRMLQTQEPRLLQTFGRADVRMIETEYDAFVRAVEREPILSGVLHKHGRDTDVAFAWSCVDGRFQLLQEFVGGLAAVGTDATASSSGSLARDLVALNWEKPDYRQTMLDFALEGVLHAKQKRKLELVDIDYPTPPVTSPVTSPVPVPLPTAAMPNSMLAMGDHDMNTADASSLSGSMAAVETGTLTTAATEAEHELLHPPSSSSSASGNGFVV